MGTGVSYKPFLATAAISLLCLFLLMSCDAVEPSENAMLVVEGFLDAGRPLPELTLRRTRPVSQPYANDSTTVVTDAAILLNLDGLSVPYYHRNEKPGRYAPDSTISVLARDGSHFSMGVQWGNQFASAEGWVPPAIYIDSIRITISDEPVEAVLLDSLNLDSLNTGARKGYIYPVEVSLWWYSESHSFEHGSSWIRAQLKPYVSFSSTIIDFFLKPDQIILERAVHQDAHGAHQWIGVYAVPVKQSTDPFPLHELKVSLLRSGQDYARYASSRDAPERREPAYNVKGAIGIVTGISVDSVRFPIEKTGSILAYQRLE